MNTPRARTKRGRPPKFGRRGHVVALTLPEEAIRAVQSVVSVLRRQPIDKFTAAEKSTDELLGLFRDEPELLDQIVQEAISARETLPLLSGRSHPHWLELLGFTRFSRN